MSARFMRLIAVLCLLAAVRTPAATLYVDLNSPGPVAPYSTWATAATNIQDAVDFATNGDTVLVTNGVYASGGRTITFSPYPFTTYSLTNRVMVTNAVSIQSKNGPSVTIIQGYQVPGVIIGNSAVRCIYLADGASLSGFTLTGGATLANNSTDPLEYGGGVYCETTNVAISNCVIVSNAANIYGGGVDKGNLINCILVGNSSLGGFGFGGGGASASILINCLLSNNYTLGFGGGVMGSSLSNCSIIANNARGMGGGAYSCTLNNCTLSGNASSNRGAGAAGGTLNNCLVVSNSPLGSPALPIGAVYSATLNNCTVVGNYGGKITGTTGGTLNCTNNNSIVYFNTVDAPVNPTAANFSGGIFNYSCTTPLPVGGVGNISSNPSLTDFHISAFSPCRGAGSSLYTSGTDLDGEAWLNPPSMGCDEYYGRGPLTVAIQANTTTVAPGFSANFTAQITGSLASNKLDFGDGTILTNVFSASHVWPTLGDYPVVLTAYNLDYPGGVSATNIIHVIANPFQYVNLNSTNPTSPYNSWATAATNIQDAVDVGFPGGTILVSNGVYQSGGRTVSTTQLTNRVAVTRTVILKSVNGPSVTSIQGNRATGFAAVRCVYLTNGASLIGFTLSNGGTSFSSFIPQTIYEDYGAGAFCATNAVISNCVITGNLAYHAGGGVYGGLVYDSIISNNSAYDGGGSDSAVLFNCLLTGNAAFQLGGGACSNVLYNCLLTGNSATNGGGSYGDTLQNCIIWSNTAPTNPNYASTLSYCCTTPMPTNGIGNITNDPLFINFANGNFRLQSSSPCINAGNNAAVTTATDLDGHPRILGGTVDIGAYEFEPRFVDASSVNPVAPYTSWATAATNIQDAVDAATIGDTVLVTNGIYATGGRVVYGSMTNRVAIAPLVTVQSVNGPGNTLIVGGVQTRCVYVGSNSVLSGFTLTNGQTAGSGDLTNEQSGAGAWCEASGVVSGCIVKRNVMAGFHQGLGGGIYGGTVWNCSIISNSAYFGGGVAAATVFNSLIISNSVFLSGLAGGSGAYGSTLSNCQLIANGGDGNGGGACNSILINSLLSNNSCWYDGGGAYNSTLFGCKLAGNSAGDGGGADQSTLFNCLIVSNSAAQGGAADASSLYNCSVALNLSTGTFGCGGVLGLTGPSFVFNNIIYSNFTLSSVSNYSGNVTFQDTCTWPLPVSGLNNFTNTPLFVNSTNDFHLQSNSPCINAGNNLYTTNGPDLDGNPRIVGGTVDIGAYEFQNPTSQLSYAWLQQYNLPTDGSTDFADTDSDGQNNYQEWRSGTDPTNPNSKLLLLKPTNSGTNLIITWQSVTTRNYYLQRSLGLTPPSFQPLATNIPGQSGTTSYTDTNAPAPGPWFYRVGVQ